MLVVTALVIHRAGHLTEAINPRKPRLFPGGVKKLCARRATSALLDPCGGVRGLLPVGSVAQDADEMYPIDPS